MTGYRVECETEVAVPAPEVFALLADYGGWPLLFRRVVHVDLLPGDGPQQLLRLWALAPSATGTQRLDDWICRCVTDPAEAAVTFRLVATRPPAAALAGRWRVRGSGPARCVVTLTYDFEAIADDAESVRRLARTLERLADADLTALRRGAELRTGQPGLSFTFGDEVTVHGPAAALFSFFVHARDWPRHVVRFADVAVREDHPGTQFLEARLREPDGSARISSRARICFPERGLIVEKYLPLEPPCAGHTAHLLVEPDGAAAVASWRHTVILDPAAVREQFGGPAFAQAADKVRRLAGADCLLLLRGGKRYAENGGTPGGVEI